MWQARCLSQRRRVSELLRLQSLFAARLLSVGEAPDGLFRGDPARAVRRFALYRGNLTANWNNSLGNAYPVLRALVGAEFFRALAREFGRARPFAEGDLNRFGHGLASFLEDFGPVADYPYFPDIARLEWLLHRAHYAADTPALDLSALATMDAATLDTLTLRLREGCTLLHSAWDVVGIWQAHQTNGPAWPEDIAQSSHCLVCRPHWRAELMPLSFGEYTALQAVTGGMALGPALEAASDADPQFDPATALPRWLQAGIFAAPSSTEDH